MGLSKGTFRFECDKIKIKVHTTELEIECGEETLEKSYSETELCDEAFTETESVKKAQEKIEKEAMEEVDDFVRRKLGEEYDLETKREIEIAVKIATENAKQVVFSMVEDCVEDCGEEAEKLKKYLNLSSIEAAERIIREIRTEI